MNVQSIDAQRQHLRPVQRQWRNDEGYVPVTVLPLLDKGRAPASVAEDLGLDQAYRYAAAFATLGLGKCLLHE